MEVYPSVIVSDLKIVVQFYLFICLMTMNIRSGPSNQFTLVLSLGVSITGLVLLLLTISVVIHIIIFVRTKKKELNSRTELPTIYEELDHVDTTQGVVDTESNMAYTTAVHAT